jgi:predicted nucleotidyltransferase
MTFKRYDIFTAILYLYKTPTHVRELSRQLNISLTKTQAILKMLLDSNVVDYAFEGKNQVYFVKRNIFARTSLILAENYTLLQLILKYPRLESLFKEIMLKSPDTMIILFGSYAKLIPKKDSDIDIYIDTEDKTLKDKLKLISETLSIKIGTFNTDDLLIQEIIKNHVIIQGVEKYYEKIKFFK